MDQKTAYALLLVALVLMVGVTAATASSDMQPAFIDLQQQANQVEKLAVSVPLVIGVGLHNDSTCLVNPLVWR